MRSAIGRRLAIIGRDDMEWADDSSTERWRVVTWIWDVGDFLSCTPQARSSNSMSRDRRSQPVAQVKSTSSSASVDGGMSSRVVIVVILDGHGIESLSSLPDCVCVLAFGLVFGVAWTCVGSG